MNATLTASLPSHACLQPALYPFTVENGCTVADAGKDVPLLVLELVSLLVFIATPGGDGVDYFGSVQAGC
jgi:hypothetical protein